MLKTLLLEQLKRPSRSSSLTINLTNQVPLLGLSVWYMNCTETPRNTGKSQESKIKYLTNARAQKNQLKSWKTSFIVNIATVPTLMDKKQGEKCILPVGSNKAWTSMSSGKPTKLSSSQNLTTWSSEAVWVLTLVHDVLNRDLYQGAEEEKRT